MPYGEEVDSTNGTMGTIAVVAAISMVLGVSACGGENARQDLADADPGSDAATAGTEDTSDGDGTGGTDAGDETSAGDDDSSGDGDSTGASIDEDASLELVSVSIDSEASNRLRLRFNRAVGPTDGAGVRLVGGAASIAGPPSQDDPFVLSFPLSDHVLPDDAFTVSIWPEQGLIESATPSEHDDRLAAIEGVPVESDVESYAGEGSVYYVAADGRDGGDGSRDDPFATLARGAQEAGPGDYVLLRRDDTFTLPNGPGGSFRGHFEPPTSGEPGRPVTFGAYGAGAKPRVEAPSGSGSTIAIRNADYVHLDSLHVVADGGDYGILFSGSSIEPTVSNCSVTARDDNGGYGGIYYAASVDGAHVRHPVVQFSDVRGFRTNFSSNGYDMSDRHEVLDGGLLEGNVSGDVTIDNGHDGFKAARGEFNGLVIRRNVITGWLDDGLETFGAQDVTVEHNILHAPQPPAITEGAGNHASQGIKAGGTDSTNGYYAARIVVRYNEVYDLPYDAASVGIKVNGGRSGEIYGNVVHDVRRIGIKVDCDPCEEDGWRVHHNTVVAAGTDGIQVYNGGDFGHHVEIFNNILDGAAEDLRVTAGNGQSAVGGNNLLVHGSVGGDYQGSADFEAALDSLFEDLDGRDLHLRSGAAAIDAATLIEDYAIDRDGMPVPALDGDVGAYEHTP